MHWQSVSKYFFVFDFSLLLYFSERSVGTANQNYLKIAKGFLKNEGLLNLRLDLSKIPIGVTSTSEFYAIKLIVT